jgi:hypothetical protein
VNIDTQPNTIHLDPEFFNLPTSVAAADLIGEEFHLGQFGGFTDPELARITSPVTMGMLSGTYNQQNAASYLFHYAGVNPACGAGGTTRP